MIAVRRCVRLLALFWVFFWSANVGATVLTPVDEHDLVTKAELIFEGVVTGAQTRLSDRRDPKDAAIPFTFVTFKIERVFKGSTDTPDSITLRFVGGSVRTGFLRLKERSLFVPGVPQFAVGDREILFVRGNGRHVSPLVGWQQGRFRVVQEEVFTDGGREVWLTPEGVLTYGKVHQVGAPSARRPLGQSKELAPSTTEQLPKPSAGKRLDRKTFGEFIAGSVQRLHTQEELRQLLPVRSISIKAKTYAPALTPVPPPAVPPKGD